jgi:two-component system, chemotaxis family, chemotaxis protein CheY
MPSKVQARPIGSTVVVVDDDDDIRDAVREALHAEGYDTAGASNGQDALDMLHASSERPVLILLDLMMPTMDGWEFLLNIDHDDEMHDIPVALMSAHPSVQGNLDGDHDTCGFTRLLLPKPLDFTRLMSFVRSVCLASSVRPHPV